MDIYELEDMSEAYEKCKSDGVWKLHDEWMNYVYQIKLLRKKGNDRKTQTHAPLKSFPTFKFPFISKHYS